MKENEPITIYDSSWVQGSRAAAYHGPISAMRFKPDGEGALDYLAVRMELAQEMATRAREMGGNSIVGSEFTMDLFFVNKEGVPGVFYMMVGTVAKLEPLF